MRNIIGILIFFVTGIIIGGGFLQLGLSGSFILGAICFTAYHALVTKEMLFPIMVWVFIAGCAVFAWLMF